MSIPLSQFKRKCRPRRGGNFRHGLSDSRLESIREKMMDRCHNPKADNYHRYGGRGIEVCRQWREEPATFYEWALANGYSDDLLLDREKNHLGYSPSNCRWVTTHRRHHNRINVQGRPMTASEFARKLGLPSRRDGYKWTSAMKAMAAEFQQR